MPQQVQIKNGPVLTIADLPFASGGEGDLYRITGVREYENLVVKIYKPEKQTAEREKKIEFLSENPPYPGIQNGHDPVIWVDKPVYRSGKFIGFTMPLAKGEKLELLCNPRLPAHLGPLWKKFAFTSPKSLELRQKICFNIAVAVSEIHSRDTFVLIDLKPENIMIQSNGLVSIIDTDSVQVFQNGGVLFFAPVVTPEYTPPEYYRGIIPERAGAPKSWDCFSMAVIFYRLLCGIHPFVGSCLPPFEHCNSYELKIENGLFPNGKNRAKYKIIPKEHENFQKLPAGIQDLFVRCFDEGHGVPGVRPSVEDWCVALLPDAVFQLAKSLPSFANKYPEYTYAGKIDFTLDCTVTAPVYTFPQFQKESFLESIVNRFLIYSKKEQLRALLKKKQRLFSSSLTGFQEIEGQLTNLVASYLEQQAHILEWEKKEIDMLKASFKAALSELDDSAKGYLEHERKEIRAFQENFQAKISALHNDIASLRSVILDPLTTGFEAKKIQHQELLASIAFQKQKDISQAVNDPEKLAKYVIAPLTKEIFNSSVPQVVLSLQNAGIYTAADFVSVNAKNAIIITSKGRQVKVAGLGPVRAAMLGNWRTAVEQKEDQILIAAIVSESDSATGEANSRFDDYEKHWKELFKVSNDDYERERKLLEAKIAHCNKEYRAGQEKLQAALSASKETELMKGRSSAATLVEETIQKQTVISESVQARLKENLHIHRTEAEEIKRKQKQLEMKTGALYKEICALQHDFSVLLNAE